ncbi:2-oxoacid:acceptor oxidoreductase, gamma subunit, pyruvate/2-ketoisovalerate family [Halobacteroides halobius DSM 5150]|uniref:2-oxoacid:acceptor oxidoreductase, gamma subunit, pyruvate/2-ketoisovalerate family n=1 Tax=Halobacteroides halobius (strain ATCC 35273 / DSM 5150 / MD-1) TaxID=748449 RepID=L0K455_HALHC|nr:2-oxoacid:acceptor oxidoreductase family protein [Halobacteroides halobius]AGB40072.1 2-oxoacid:acceptor oxidoreductase, gamma subunit, pyruvate/2-ketoisovalerate family [Halobacteroides halobius DSM 5150]
MASLTEIRWHGRGGQGAKTASILLGKVAAKTGKHIQAFPEYGPERMGAPVLAYNRISEDDITVHCQVTDPGIVTVLDPTLLNVVDVTDGVPEDGTLVVNSEEDVATIKEQLEFDGDIWVLDAYGVANKEIGRPFPNTPMLGALMQATDLLPFENFVKQIKVELEKKFAHKPEMIDKNVAAIKRAYKEVAK